MTESQARRTDAEDMTEREAIEKQLPKRGKK